MTQCVSPRQLFCAVLLILLPLIYSGCAKQYLVVAFAGGEIKAKSRQAEVSETVTYLNNRNNIKTISFRVPDECLATTAARAKGESQSTDLILRTACAVWLAELERALLRYEYRIISWDALERYARQKQVSTYVAARELGADLVFILNSLETSNVDSGSEQNLSYLYYESDPEGNRIREAMLLDSVRENLRTMIASRSSTSGAVRSADAISATLDTTAILSNTGESIWFYRRSVTQIVKDVTSLQFLFRGKGKYWRPVKPLQADQETVIQQEQTASRDVIAQSASSTTKDPYQAQKFDLVRRVATDFVAQFRGTR